MARLDVTEILTDPDFVDTALVCERSAQSVGTDGLAVNSTKSIRFAGVVTSDQGDILERMPGVERITGSITIHSRFVLNDGSPGKTADVVQWRGRRYTVSNVNDYSHFGRGFIVATCDLIPLAG
jgi:hypothetical protein